MLGSAKIVAFVLTANPAIARDFYERTLGLRLVSEDDFAFVFDAGGTTVRLTKIESFDPSPHTIVGWEVPDIRAAVGQLMGRGVTFERYDGVPQDDLAIWSSPEMAIAWFKDPEGNVLSVAQPLAP